MTLNYRGYNFIIFEPEETLSSGAYFSITMDQNNVYATMLKDSNFSLIDKKKYNYKLYLANGNIYKEIEKIKNNNLEYKHFCTLITDNYKELSDSNVKISFYEHAIEEGLFLSNPVITINRRFLDTFIDNL